MSNGRHGRGQRMPKHWHFIASAIDNFTANGAMLGGSLALDGPWTVLRMLGEYLIHFSQGGTIVVGDTATIGVGIGVVSTDAVAAGAGSMPDPNTEAEYPWLYWAQHFVVALTANPAQVQDGVGVVRRSFDIRSMRKLKPRESLVVVLDYFDNGGAPPVTVEFATTRVLVAT